MGFIELTMYQIAGMFLLPVFAVLAVLFVYALFELGRFLFEIVQRRFSANIFARGEPRFTDAGSDRHHDSHGPSTNGRRFR